MGKKVLFTTLFLASMFNLFGQKKATKPVFSFKEPENTACFTCSHVVDGHQPILYASHDADGDWQFLCGQDAHTEETAKVISLGEAVKLDGTLNELYEMPCNVGAERSSPNAKWKPFRLGN